MRGILPKGCHDSFRIVTTCNDLVNKFSFAAFEQNKSKLLFCSHLQKYDSSCGVRSKYLQLRKTLSEIFHFERVYSFFKKIYQKVYLILQLYIHDKISLCLYSKRKKDFL